MPAQRSYGPKQFEEDFKIWVEGDLERRKNVYFTDQSPCFRIFVENTGEKPIQIETFSRLSFEESSKSHESEASQRIETVLDPGEREEFRHEVDMLAYQGSAALSIDGISLREYEDRIETRNTHNRLFRLYTFVVYDRDYYKVNYLRPRWTQYIAMILSVIVVLVGVFQAYLVFAG